MRTYTVVAIALAAALGASGCNATRAVSAWAQSKTGFYTCTADTRILCEPGSEALAQAAAPLLPQALEVVARAQFAPFPQPIVIYTYATRDSYAAHSSGHISSAGQVFNAALHLSPKVLDQPGRAERILSHELSHLHLRLQMGGWTWGRIPGWFHEGLAVFVSNGGAENVSADTAFEAIRHGRSFVPEGSSSTLFPKSAASYGLEPHMYYRQAALFVGFMRDENRSAFEAMIKTLAAGTPFAEAVQSSFGKPLPELWEMFLEKAKSAERPTAKSTDTFA